ncbi:MAG: hypothetical protein ACRENP_26655, partial [Longimicrobiales bacterium]
MPNELDAQLEEERLSEVDARRVLERAIALDASRAGDTTISELRRVAQELNVSPTAFAEALRELQSKAVAAPARPAQQAPVPAPSAPVEVNRRRNWWRTLGIGLGTFALGTFNYVDAPRDPEASALLLFCASLALVAKHRRDRTPGEYQNDILALFGAMTLAWLPSGFDDMVYVTVFGWLAASTIGGFLTR